MMSSSTTTAITTHTEISSTDQFSLNRVKKWFAIFCSIHLLVWTLLPTIFINTIPLDTAEGIIWGRAWQWGYYKHPPLAAWLSNIAYLIQGTPGFSVYLLSQIAVIITFWAVWKFSLKIISPIQALVSVICLEGIYYFAFPSTQFNPDILMLPLWALLTLKFYEALHSDTLKDWLAVGVLTGLSMLAKYESLILLVPIVFFTLYNKEARKALRRPGVYLATLASLVIFMPNLIWLFKHHFIAVTYALNASQVDANAALTPGSSSVWQTFFIPRISYPYHYLQEQLSAILPAYLLLLFFANDKKQSCLASETHPINENITCETSTLPDGGFLRGRTGIFLFKHIQGKSKNQLDSSTQQFLLIICCGPFLFTLLLSIFLGVQIGTYWAIPYFSFFGTVLLAYYKPVISMLSFRRFIIAVSIVFSLLVFGSIGALYYLPYKKGHALHQQYPAKNMATFITKQWHTRYHTRLDYLAGDKFMVDTVGAYAKDRPSVYIDWYHAMSPWINEQQLRKKGGIFIWPVKNNNSKVQLPGDVHERFPQAQVQGVIHFNKLTKAHVPGVNMAYAFLPPEMKYR